MSRNRIPIARGRHARTTRQTPRQATIEQRVCALCRVLYPAADWLKLGYCWPCWGRPGGARPFPAAERAAAPHRQGAGPLC